MRHVSKYTFLLCLFLLVSCNEDFLEETPTQRIGSSSATESVENLLASINGTHRALYLRYDSQDEGGLGCQFLQLEALGDDYVMNARSNGWYINTYRWRDHISEFDSDTEFPYEFYYYIMRNANVIINGAEEAVGSASVRNGVIGQALVYRAYCLLQLVQIYGDRYVPGQANSQLGVPIPLEPNLEQLPRSTVEEVYAQIHRDLDEAITLFANYSRPDKSHLDASVALGLKARASLVQGRWQDAIQYATQAREDYELMTQDEYVLGFNDFSNREWMWGSHIIAEQTLFFANFGAYISRNFSSTNIRGNPKSINSRLYDMIPTSDVRTQVFDPTGEHENLPQGYSLNANGSHRKFPYTNQKFLAVSNSDSRMDVVYMRAAEMYLIEAEAYAHLGDDANAANALFELNSVRDTEYTLSTNAGEDLLEEIMNYRRIELWGEGFRWFDLKRLNLPLDRTESNHTSALTGGLLEVPAGDPRWTWKIPQDAIDANPLLVQN